MPAYFIKRITSRQRNRRSNVQLGLILSFIAGAVNVSGFLAIGSYTSHMTGIVSSIGNYLVHHQNAAAIMALSYVLAFATGAITSTIITNWARAKELHSEFAITFMLEALLLLKFTFLAEHLAELEIYEVNVAIALLCFIMGLQNALITKISRADIRTTHVTGIVTDIGIQIGHYIYKTLTKNPDIVVLPEKLSLHVGLLGCFASGSIAGAYLFDYTGFLVYLPFAIVLMIMAALPIAADIKTLFIKPQNA